MAKLPAKRKPKFDIEMAFNTIMLEIVKLRSELAMTFGDEFDKSAERCQSDWVR